MSRDEFDRLLEAEIFDPAVKVILTREVWLKIVTQLRTMRKALGQIAVESQPTGVTDIVRSRIHELANKAIQ